MRPLISAGRSRRDFVGESRDLVDEVVEVGGEGSVSLAPVLAPSPAQD